MHTICTYLNFEEEKHCNCKTYIAYSILQIKISYVLHRISDLDSGPILTLYCDIMRVLTKVFKILCSLKFLDSYEILQDNETFRMYGPTPNLTDFYFSSGSTALFNKN